MDNVWEARKKYYVACREFNTSSCFFQKESAWYIDIKENMKPRARNRCEGIITMTTEIIIIITDSVQGIILSVLHIFILCIYIINNSPIFQIEETEAQRLSNVPEVIEFIL